MAQNHGKLSVYIHPLTKYDIIDHTQRGSWMGEKVVINEECTCWSKELQKQHICPVYPVYPDNVGP